MFSQQINSMNQEQTENAHSFTQNTTQLQQFFLLMPSTDHMELLINQIQRRQCTKHQQSSSIIKVKTSDYRLVFPQLNSFEGNIIEQGLKKLTKINFYCQFTFLQTINISNSQINNCQFLRFLDVPTLRLFYFSYNKVSNVRCLFRTEFKYLQVFNISVNEISNFQVQRFKIPELTESMVLQLHNNDQTTIENLSNIQMLILVFRQNQNPGNQQNISKQNRLKNKIKISGLEYLKQLNSKSIITLQLRLISDNKCLTYDNKGLEQVTGIRDQMFELQVKEIQQIKQIKIIAKKL